MGGGVPGGVEIGGAWQEERMYASWVAGSEVSHAKMRRREGGKDGDGPPDWRERGLLSMPLFERRAIAGARYGMSSL